MNKEQLTINNKKSLNIFILLIVNFIVNSVGKRSFHTHSLLLLVHCSLLIVNCSNPLVIHILGPKTVSFETNGGSRIESQIVYRDYPIKRPPNPSRSGHTFEAWYIDNETFEEQWDFGVIPTADITLYAKWISGGGTEPGDDPSDPGDPGDDPGDPGDDPGDPGDGPGDPGDDPGEPGDPDDPGDDTFTVIFDANGGTLEPPPKDIVNGGKIEEPPPPKRAYSPVEEGLYLNSIPTEYTFSGWFTDDETFENKWDFSTDTVLKDRTLYAKWTSPNRIPGIGEYNNIISDAVNHVKNNANAGKYILLLKEISTGGQAGTQTINADNFNLTIEAIGPRTITYNGTSDSFFTINNPTATLTLGKNFTLHGNAVNNSLITVTRGKLIMETGSKITGHKGGSITGSAVYVDTNGEFIMNDGEITANRTYSGGTVYVRGKFTMEDGTISKNETFDGGGVSVSGGTFNMNGGTIIENSSTYKEGDYDDKGGNGGVQVSSNGTFIMSGGTITQNTGRLGGGVQVGINGTFIMSGGIITNNTATFGGGVSVKDGEFIMNSGGTISKNSGGVYVNDGTFTMNNGIISENHGGDGGGVKLISGTFNMVSGEITGNSAVDTGGGVRVEGGTFNMSGGTISGNTAGYNGGGVFFYDGVFRIGGTARIFDNTKTTLNNAYLFSGQYITLGNGTFGVPAPTNGMRVYAGTDTPSGVIVDIGAINGDQDYFRADNGGTIVLQGGQLVIQP